MAPRTSKKTQADLMAVVKAAGWKEDQKTAGDKHIRWWHPSKPETYYTLRDAADLVRLRTAGVAKQDRLEPRL
jgi:hypothetical protein